MMKPRIESLLATGGASSDLDGRRHKGGGGGSAFYNNLEQLYGEQAAQARDLRQVAEGTVIPQYQRLVDDANNFDSIDQRQQAADRAMASGQAATAAATKQFDQDASSYGIDPNDERRLRQKRVMETAGAAQSAAGANQAYDQREREGWARRSDVTSLGMGIPGQATAAFNSAAGIAGQGMGYQQRQQEIDSNNWGNAVGGAMGAYRLFKGGNNSQGGGYADGGPVKKGLQAKRGRKMATGGFMAQPQVQQPEDQRFGTDAIHPKDLPLVTYYMKNGFASGGIVGGGGFFQPIQAPIPPASNSQPQRPSDAGAVGKVARTPGLSSDIGTGIKWVGDQTGAQGMSNFGAGMQNPALNASAQAQQFVDKTLPDVMGKASSTYGTNAGSAQTAMLGLQDASVDGALSSTAADAGISSAASAGAAGGADAAATGILSSAAGSTLAAALPYVGAGLAVGSALGWFEKGGFVDKKGLKRANYMRGGDVNGPGGPHDDKIPAWLSDGEYVLNAEAVRHFGLDRLEKMNKLGLQIRQQQQSSQ